MLLHITDHYSVIDKNIQETVADLVKNHVPSDAINIFAAVFIDSPCFNEINGFTVIVDGQPIPVRIHQILEGTNVAVGTTTVSYELEREVPNFKIQTTVSTNEKEMASQLSEDGLRRLYSAKLPFTITKSVSQPVLIENGYIFKDHASLFISDGIMLFTDTGGNCFLNISDMTLFCQKANPYYTKAELKNLTSGETNNLLEVTTHLRYPLVPGQSYRVTVDMAFRHQVFHFTPK